MSRGQKEIMEGIKRDYIHPDFKLKCASHCRVSNTCIGLTLQKQQWNYEKLPLSTRRVQFRILQMPCNTPPAPEQITADEGTFHGRYHLFACLCPSLSHLWVGMFPERTPLLGCKSLSRFSAHIHKEIITYQHVSILLEWLTSPPKKN